MGMHVGPGRIGQINAGATADLAFFDVPVDVGSPHAVEGMLRDFVRHGAGTNRATMISGTIVYADAAFEGDSAEAKERQ